MGTALLRVSAALERIDPTTRTRYLLPGAGTHQVFKATAGRRDGRPLQRRINVRRR